MAESSPASSQDAKVIPRPRIQTLSDLIFGLALSIGAIALISSKPSNLSSLVGSLTLFGFSFLILAFVWFRYTNAMSVLPVETGTLVAANMVLLFLVSIEPYLFNLVSFAPPPGQLGAPISTAAYALDIGLMNLILAYFYHELSREGTGRLSQRFLRSFRLMRNSLLVSSAMFFVSVFPVFWDFTIYGSPVRLLIWIATFAVAFIRRGVELRGASTAT
ncbi:MAG: TMEM175 family protein [Thaumarchaeota archaeon]|nr:TMEM175 family protein [Nitrososphaerota archaeon]